MKQPNPFSRLKTTAIKLAKATKEFFAGIGEGKATPEDKRFRDWYREFRALELSRTDSFYNSLYICVQERKERTKKTVTLFEKSTSPHPLGWEENTQKEVYASFWVLCHRALTRVPYWVRKPFSLIKKRRAKRKGKWDNLLHAFSGFWQRLYRRLPVLIPLVLAIVVFGYIYSVASAEIVIGAKVDGKKIGLIQDMDQLNEAVDQAEDKASKVLGRSFKFPYPFSYYFSYKEGFLTQTELYTKLIGCLGEYISPGYGLYVDDKLVAALRTEEEITRALKELVTEEQAAQKENYTVKLHSRTRIAQETFPTQKMTDREHLKELLLYGSSDYSSLSLLARIYEPQYAVCANPGLRFVFSLGEDAYQRARKAAEDVDFSNTLYYYEETKNEHPEEVLPVVFSYTKRVTTVGQLEYPTNRVNDPDLYVGGEEIQTKGQKGQGILTTDYTYINGKLTAQQVVSTQVVLQPVTQVIRVGAKPLPEETVSDQLKVFILPKEGALNSGFGWRDMNGDGKNDDFHTGLDIEAPMRSNIYASLSGTVVFAQDYSTYGKLIRIKHNNGYETYYAHLDEFLVKEGDQVRQGQLIGLSGNTGYTTGPHFHFELHKPGGSAVNPLSYMYKEK